MLPLDVKLKNGDIVEIITKEGSHPTEKWLNYAKTPLAKRTSGQSSRVNLLN